MTNLIVCDVTIKQDAEGRYCLNDLHKAAGGEDRHQPAHFWEAAGDKLLQVLILENPRVSPKVALRKVGEEEITLYPIQGKRGVRNAKLIAESGLYKLIMRSDKPEARRFQDWVTREVLPAIRKDGAYIMGEEKVATGKEHYNVMRDIRSMLQELGKRSIQFWMHLPRYPQSKAG